MSSRLDLNTACLHTLYGKHLLSPTGRQNYEHASCIFQVAFFNLSQELRGQCPCATSQRPGWSSCLDLIPDITPRFAESFETIAVVADDLLLRPKQ